MGFDGVWGSGAMHVFLFDRPGVCLPPRKCAASKLQLGLSVVFKYFVGV